MNGSVDTDEEKLAVDMDLLNNASGRTIGNAWKTKSSSFRALNSTYPEIPVDDWAALGYYVLHEVSFGRYLPRILTFSTDSINGTLGTSSLPSFYEGLVYTNFGEKENWEKIIGNSTTPYSKRPYFNYPPGC